MHHLVLAPPTTRDAAAAPAWLRAGEQLWENAWKRLDARPFLGAAVIALLTPALYLGYSLALNLSTQQPLPLAYPLDDSWIHQVFARNLATRGELAFNPGEPSAGSTSVLWTGLLAGGYLLRVPHLAWSYLLGWLCYLATAALSYLLAGELFPGMASRRLHLAALFLALLEWHLAWAAFSGMETLLFTVLSMLSLWLSARRAPAISLGIALGAATWARPEGVLLAGLLLGERVTGSLFPHLRASSLRVSAVEEQNSTRAQTLCSALLGGLSWLAIVAPLAWLNWTLGGSIFPQTVAAKGYAYGPVVTVQSITMYLVQAAYALLPGPLLLLMPLALYGAVVRLRRRALPAWPVYVWPTVLVAVYAARLPAAYHHGRYLMPLVPVLAILGLDGLRLFIARGSFVVLPKAMAGLAALTALVTWLNGAVIYAWDVRFITDMQVKAALWVAANTQPHDLVATHDIGAIGYFGQRRVLDMAGLVTPETVPYLHNHEGLLDYLRRENATVVVKFTRWFPVISERLAAREVARFHYPYITQDDMVIYALR
jgi:arabinofuranosyltransferase